MKDSRHSTRPATLILALALAGAMPLAYADQSAAPAQAAPGSYGMGPGMMGGYGPGYGMGPGMMGGYGPGYGMGPGMMGGYGPGYGMGPGMMGGYGPGYGMGPGMMGGYGMGPGAMRGYHGYGMMGPYWGAGLDLTDQQRDKINAIMDSTRKAHWALMGAMMDQHARLRDLYNAPKRDQAAIDEAYGQFGKLQQQMYQSSVEAQKQMEAVLTKEQQEKLKEYWGYGAPRPRQ